MAQKKIQLIHSIQQGLHFPFLSFNSVSIGTRFRVGLLFLCFLAFAFYSTAQDIPPRPQPPRLVNDFANMLAPSQVEALEQKLVAYNDSTSTQIAIVIIPTVGDYAMVQYAVKLGRTWGVGGEKFNNGVVMLIAEQDHKAFIATGYGMEGSVPDATAKTIVDQDIIPNFRGGNYYEGLDQATSDIIAAAAGEYKASPRSGKKKGSGAIFFIIFILIIVVVVFLSSRGGGGGDDGRGGGTMYNRRGYGLGPFLGGAILGGMLGGGFRGGGGGFGGGGGGFGGGGFGGFGGGGFGGGGAGGSW